VVSGERDAAYRTTALVPMLAVPRGQLSPKAEAHGRCEVVIIQSGQSKVERCRKHYSRCRSCSTAQSALVLRGCGAKKLVVGGVAVGFKVGGLKVAGRHGWAHMVGQEAWTRVFQRGAGGAYTIHAEML